MDALTLKTSIGEDGVYQVQWQWARSNQRIPHVGVLHVSVDRKWAQERAALAEVQAIFHLLHEREIHGTRLGNGIAIRVSEKTIVQAVHKKALKTTGAGRANPSPVIQAVDFLATKFFEADVTLGKWTEPTQYKQFEAASISVGVYTPTVLVECPLIGQPLRISRRAMYRYLARIDQKLHKLDEDDLSKVPNARWSHAWNWLTRVLVNPNLEEARVSSKALARVTEKYGEGTRYLRFPDAGNVILVVRVDERGPVLATVLVEDLYNPFFERLPVMKGAHLMTHSNAMAKRAARK